MLHDFMFQDRWINWIMDCVEALSFAILINGSPTKFFHLIDGFAKDALFFFTCLFYMLMLSRALWVAVQGLMLEPHRPILRTMPLSHLLLQTTTYLLVGPPSEMPGALLLLLRLIAGHLAS